MTEGQEELHGVSESQIAVHWREEEYVYPPARFIGQANAADPVLGSIRDSAARATLVAVPDGEGRLRFDIRLQGEDETVFFDV